MTENQDAQLNDVHPGETPNPDKTRQVLYWGVGVTAVLVVAVVAFRVGDKSSATASANTPVEAVAAAIAPDPAVLEQNSLAAVEQARRAFAQSQLSGLKHEAERAMAECELLEQEMVLWDQQIAPLLTNEDGRYLAADPEYAKTFDTVFKKSRATRQNLLGMRARVQPLLIHVEEALSEPSKMFAPPRDFGEQIQEELLAARSARDGYRADRELLLGMLREAKSNERPGAMSLTVAIASLQKDYEQEKARAIAVMRDRYEQEMKERLAEIELRKGREIAEERARLKEREMEEERVRLASQAEELKATTELDRKKALATRADIQKRFESFLAEGRVRICILKGLSSPMLFDRPGPCSYANLRQQGVLDDPRAFAKARAPHKKHYFNDRPTRAMPQTTAEWERNDEDFALFQELAPVFRDLGLLRP